MDVQATVRPPASLAFPQVSLIGRVDEERLRELRDKLREIPDGDDDVAIEVTTLGGDAEMGRRAMLEIDEARERLNGRRLVFVGKTAVYSAGVTMMSAFPRADRFLTGDAMLLIHCRQLDEEVRLSGPIRASLPLLQAKCHEIETGIALEVEAFERLIQGSDIAMDDLLERALHNWYVRAEEAVELGLVAGIV